MLGLAAGVDGLMVFPPLAEPLEKHILKGLLLQWSHAMRGLVGEFDIRISFKSFYSCLAARFNRHNISLVR